MYENCLCVDLDKTLINNDLSVESLIRLILKKPFKIFKVLSYIIKSNKAGLKEFIAQNVTVDFKNLPYNEEVIQLIKNYKAEKQDVFLVTGSHMLYAEKVADTLNLFDNVFATEQENLVSKSKANHLEQIFGKHKFDYIGDSSKDIPVWESSNKKYLVSRNGKNKFKNINFESIIRSSKHQSATYFIKQIRIYQWVKNLLIFTPVITSLSFSHVDLVIRTSIITFLFSLLASAIYITNDIFDVDNDRAHSEKRKRPLASGNISLMTSVITTLLFLTISITGSYFISPLATILFLFYIFLNIIYSTKGKKLPVFDFLFLCFFYLIRIFIGSATTNISLSTWLLGFAFYFFLSLGVMKRYIEVSKYLPYKDDFGRDYTSEDSFLLFVFGVASSFSSTIIMALFINEQVHRDFYSNPNFLWIVFVLINFSLLKVWHQAWKKQIPSDPVKHVLKDKVILSMILLTLFVIYMAA